MQSPSISANFWQPHDVTPLTASLSALTAFGLFAAICVSQSGSLFSADSWHDITFAAGEVKDPGSTMPRALAMGTICVTGLYVLANVAYLLVLPLSAIQHAPSDRVATAMLQAIFPGWGAVLMAAAIMISTFGCMNALSSGRSARVLLNGAGWAVSEIRRQPESRACAGLVADDPGHLVGGTGAAAHISTLRRARTEACTESARLRDLGSALIFYILTIAGVIRLRIKRPNAHGRIALFGYPVVPLIYIVGAAGGSRVLVRLSPGNYLAGITHCACAGAGLLDH